MTTLETVKTIYEWAEAHTTRLIAFALGTITTLVGTDIIPESQLKYWAAAISVLTYWRGQTTATTYTTAKAILKQQQTPPDNSQPPEIP
jgi:hypothetical protein